MSTAVLGSHYIHSVRTTTESRTITLHGAGLAFLQSSSFPIAIGILSKVIINVAAQPASVVEH